MSGRWDPATSRAAPTWRSLRILRTAAASSALAVTFLTIVPWRRSRVQDPEALRWTTVFFPVVGLGLGVILALAAVLPLPAVPGAAAVLLVWVVATGGLHEDGWMDVCDAAFAPAPREERWAILKDPRVGAHGATGGALLLLLRFGALVEVPVWGLVAAPVVGRWAMVLSLALARPLKETGLGAHFASDARPVGATLAAAAGLGAVLLLLGLSGTSTGLGAPALRVAAAWVSGGLASLLWGLFLHLRLGGLSGDGHGAVGLAGEIGTLYAALWL